MANGKGWNSSVVEAILRNTSLFLLRRNLARDANDQPRDGRYIFISGPGYGWKQWVSDGFYSALGLDDPEKTIESNRAVFWTRMDYEDNAQYYLIWAVLMKRAGGTVNEALVRRAYEFLRHNEKNGLYIPPPLPGAPNSKGWKTYHDVLPYDDDDSPASNQGFHCGALVLDPDRVATSPKHAAGQNLPHSLIGYTELCTDLPGGRHANVRTMRAMVVKADGSGRRVLAEELVREPDTWTQFAGWSPDGTKAVISRGWMGPPGRG